MGPYLKKMIYMEVDFESIFKLRYFVYKINVELSNHLF